ncbi:MAG: hypothetical protein EXS60_01825 [Candidatus Pacebacteria bacterium]|nr:hypothetical protein [Candidatus Paceibacterota bacterium]
MKKALILSIFPAIVLATGLFAFTSASAQDYYDSYGDGFDSGYSSNNLVLYDGSYYGYNADGCGLNCGSNYMGYSYSGGYSSGCGLFCGGSFSGWGGYGGGSAFLPPIYVPPRYNNPPVTLPPVYVPPTYQPPTYLPPVYVPPTYNPPSYLPPIYIPPTYNPPVYYPPPVIVQPPLVCSIRFSNFNPPLAAVEGQLSTYNLQSISTGSYSNQISYRLVNGPDGMIVLPNGQVAWTPAFNQGRANSYMVTVAAYNGSCENAETFYITAADMNPLPPTPKPKPVCPTTCATTVTTCTTTVTPTCLPKPVAPQYGVCPPDAPAAIAGITTPTDNSTGGNGFGIGSAFSAAFAGLFGALLALLYSPWLLLAVIIILAIMVIRAYQRTRSMTIAI